MLPYPFPGPFDYRVPVEIAVQPGDVVLVPLNRREEIGVVWDGMPDGAGHGSGDHGVPERKLKSLIAVLDTPPMRPDLRRLVDWIAGYTLSPPGVVMAMALRVVRPDTGRAPAGWCVADALREAMPDALPESVPESGPESGPKSGPEAGLPAARLTPARQRVLAALADGLPRSTGELAHAAGVGSGVVRTMAEAGLLAPAAMPFRAPFDPPDPDHPGPALSAAQTEAAAVLCHAVAGREFSVTLLDGVTGSGKTEVYFEAVAACLRAGRQALVLLPEIALSSQWLERFESRFGVAPAVWHSDLSSRVRRITWRAVAEGGVQVVAWPVRTAWWLSPVAAHSSRIRETRKTS